MAIYQIWNAPSPTTAKIVPVTSGTSIKTMVQVKPSATLRARIIEWGISTSAPASTATFSVELLEADAAATVTAHVAAGIVKLDALALHSGDQTTNLIQVGTTATGYTSSNENSPAASRVFDARYVTLSTAAGYEYVKQFPLGREPVLEISMFGKIRVHASVAVDVLCYITVEF